MNSGLQCEARHIVKTVLRVEFFSSVAATMAKVGHCPDLATRGYWVGSTPAELLE
jgi:hypothetical protein